MNLESYKYKTVIGPALISSISDLINLENASFPADKMSRAQYRRHINSNTASVLVAIDARGLVGSAVIFHRIGSARARLYSIAVASTAQGEGIGGRLLAAAEQDAIARGCHSLYLEVRRDNKAAISLYHKQGYLLVNYLSNYYSDGMGAWRYEKSL